MRKLACRRTDGSMKRPRYSSGRSGLCLVPARPVAGSQHMYWLMGALLVWLGLVCHATARAQERFSGADFVLVIDKGGSMTTNDPQSLARGTTLEMFLRQAALCPSVRVGFVKFNEGVRPEDKGELIRLPQEESQLEAEIRRFSEFETRGGTNFVIALREALSVLGVSPSSQVQAASQSDDRFRAVVFLTDGSIRPVTSSDASTSEMLLPKDESGRSPWWTRTLPVESAGAPHVLGQIIQQFRDRNVALFSVPITLQMLPDALAEHVQQQLERLQRMLDGLQSQPYRQLRQDLSKLQQLLEQPHSHHLIQQRLKQFRATLDELNGDPHQHVRQDLHDLLTLVRNVFQEWPDGRELLRELADATPQGSLLLPSPQQGIFELFGEILGDYMPPRLSLRPDEAGQVNISPLFSQVMITGYDLIRIQLAGNDSISLSSASDEQPSRSQFRNKQFANGLNMVVIDRPGRGATELDRANWGGPWVIHAGPENSTSTRVTAFTDLKFSWRQPIAQPRWPRETTPAVLAYDRPPVGDPNVDDWIDAAAAQLHGQVLIDQELLAEAVTHRPDTGQFEISPPMRPTSYLFDLLIHLPGTTQEIYTLTRLIDVAKQDPVFVEGFAREENNIPTIGQPNALVFGPGRETRASLYANTLVDVIVQPRTEQFVIDSLEIDAREPSPYVRVEVSPVDPVRSTVPPRARHRLFRTKTLAEDARVGGIDLFVTSEKGRTMSLPLPLMQVTKPPEPTEEGPDSREEPDEDESTEPITPIEPTTPIEPRTTGVPTEGGPTIRPQFAHQAKLFFAKWGPALAALALGLAFLCLVWWLDRKRKEEVEQPEDIDKKPTDPGEPCVPDTCPATEPDAPETPDTSTQEPAQAVPAPLPTTKPVQSTPPTPATKAKQTHWCEQLEPYGGNDEHLRDELHRIHLLVHAEAIRWREAVGDRKPSDRWGMVGVSSSEVDAFLSSTLGQHVDGDDNCAATKVEEAAKLRTRIDARLALTKENDPELYGQLRLPILQSRLLLSDPQRDILLVCLLAEVEDQYRRLFGYLQDDATRDLPDMDLVRRVLSPVVSAPELRACLQPESPLITNRLISSLGEDSVSGPSLATRSLRIDDHIISWLTGSDELDPRLTQIVQPVELVDWAELAFVLDERQLDRLAQLTSWLHQVRHHPDCAATLFLLGPADSGRLKAASAVSTVLEASLLRADIPAALRSGIEWELLVDLCFRTATLESTTLYWAGSELLLSEEHHAHQWDYLVTQTSRFPDLTWLASTAAWEPAEQFLDDSAHFLRIDFNLPGYPIRRRIWQRALPLPENFEPPIPNRDTLVELLADSFQLSERQITAAADSARSQAFVRDPQDGLLTPDDLYQACRRQSGRRLVNLARRIEPGSERTFDDLIVPDRIRRQLVELRDRIRNRSRVNQTFGFERRLRLGKGLVALFSGSSGTGKTMAAELLANDQGVDLYKVDLAALVSKYVGETEKNLRQIFAEAETSNAIIFFDEADSLFSKRGEVREARDRWANLETNYLLQRIEEFSGVVILATNLRSNIDEAFQRRLQSVVEFPFPNAAARAKILQRTLPKLELFELDLDLEGDLPHASGDSASVSHAVRCAFDIEDIDLSAESLVSKEDGIWVINDSGSEKRYEIRKSRTALNVSARKIDPRDDEIEVLAERFELPGGSIKNVVVDAAFRAFTQVQPHESVLSDVYTESRDEDQTVPHITLRHLVAATAREYQKLGRGVTETEFGSLFFKWINEDIMSAETVPR